MFQSFEIRTHPKDGPPRLAALRAELVAEPLDGFLVPRADAHQGEYVADHDGRLSWLTGFTGSAGFCAVLTDRAGVFIDGRYRVQVKSQVDLEHFTPVPWPETKLGNWLKEALPDGGTIGYDPWLHAYNEIETLSELLKVSGISLQTSGNLVDRIWHDQPPPPLGKVEVYPAELAGESHKDKRKRLAKALIDSGQSAAIITLPDSLAWLLNIRGSDIAHNPVAHGFAILHADSSVDLFIDAAKLDENVNVHLGADVRVHAPAAFAVTLASLSGKILVDKNTVPMQVIHTLETAKIHTVFDRDPCILPKARKNPAEIAGSAEAHLRDGAAMVEFLHWLDQEAPKGALTEIDVVKKLEGFRRATNALRDISFETISGAGPNGAIIHYRVNEECNRNITSGELLLVDSGGQYLDGTTDITRTIAIGEIGEDEKICFTRVLQGMIAVSRARWPKGVAGRDLDSLARYPLWLAGQDYDHGTGHGVGAFLSVHEGPVRIARTSDLPLESGMLLSNEPGYYREGAFGIRIENLIVVEPATDLPGADNREMLAFRTLTYVPIDRRLIVSDMLSTNERDWVNQYHADTRRFLSPRLSKEAREWLDAATQPL
ncbi:aminopeptidase P family protein [Pseudohalocynthiibacter aestuariivivens]|jgi:Xaa-Pro aminopeptidase|uniref:Aminopeptidase P family protein n=1 Tax=Pseudohalocynthiibacter aestuariivivens TaxID=1591409 RepID=A0ABV5JBM0_9RHOB|nr:MULTISPECIES: aminopeptidase P family protein [Pseudohalocynthiibacter]MBS9716861.1 aminopeptidase P family protein [Pseudohalocynthiibacter aestuariivivens]MCK0102046.1 aminopeptidase P family protein [Pseudohalocynthiibacter sp. F2068]